MKSFFKNFIFFAQIFAFFAFVFAAASCKNSANTNKTAAPIAIYSVTFDLSGNGENFLQKVVKGQKAVEPKDPECQGFVFDSWCWDETLKQKFDFQTPIGKNITLYAKWKVACSVTFDLSGKGENFWQNVVEGEKAVEPKDPESQGFVFDSWCWDETLKQKFDFQTPIEKNITLYAKWKAACSVTFDLSDKGENFWQNVVEGEKAVEPKDPECQGFVFDSWCWDETLEQKFDFQTPIEKNITLYAKWTKLDDSQIALTFCKNDGSQEKIVLVVQKKTPFHFKPIFSAERMFVEKWLDDDGNEYCPDELAEGGFSESKIFHAQWSKIKNAVVFCSQKDGTRISFNSEGIVDGVSFEYSFRDFPDENFGDWRKYEFGEPILLDKGKKCWFRGECGKALWQSDDRRIFFSVDGEVASWGNIMALVSHAATNRIPYENMFCRLFDGCKGLIESPELPATELTAGCYESMFYGSGLSEAPELPAANLARGCYMRMFSDCKKLTSAPELRATEMADSCYYAMFKSCESLTEAPELPAEDLAGSCYGSMFYECKNLTKAPALPAATLADSCYDSMFLWCENLEEPPELPAKELANRCYRQMFNGCAKLLHSPKLPATELKKYCYSSMFSWCKNLLDAPELPAEILQEHCYANMFGDCPNIKEVKVHFASWNDAEQATQNWLEGTAEGGRFCCPQKLSAAVRDDSHIPQSWYISQF